MLYARIQNGVVVETFTPPDGVALKDCFSPEVAVTFHEAGPQVRPGWTYANGVFAASPAPVLDLAAAKAAKNSAINAKRDSLALAGFNYPFGGTIGTRKFDMRNADDASAWTRLKTRATDRIADERGSEELDVIDASNAIFLVSADRLDAALTSLFDWRDGLQLYARKLKNQVMAAASVAVVNAIDIETGWTG